MPGAVRRSQERALEVWATADEVPAARALLRGSALAHRLEDALDEAERLSRTGRLLLTPAPVGLSHARRTCLRRILAQLGS